MSNQPPSAPIMGQTSLMGALQVSFYWQAPSDIGSAPINKYEIKILPEGGSASTYSVDETVNSYTVMNLAEDVAVYASVRASNDGGVTYGPELKFEPIKPLVAPVHAPLAPSAKVIKAGVVKVSWTLPPIDTNAKGYYMVTSQSSKPSDPVIGATTRDFRETSCELSGLNTTSMYTFSVVSVNNAGKSPASVTSILKF